MRIENLIQGYPKIILKESKHLNNSNVQLLFLGTFQVQMPIKLNGDLSQKYF